MKKLNVFLFSILVCNFAFGNSNTVITGKLGLRAAWPCPGYPEMVCPAMSVWQITNDTANFVLLKEGMYITGLQTLGNYSEGDMISIYGSFFKDEYDYGGEAFYYLKINAILKDIPSGHFSASCIDEVGDANQSTAPVITIENDSVIIRHIKHWQCCPSFALKMSEVINDTLYVVFSDMATDLCDCTCNFAVRISTIKSVSHTLKVYYNGVVYSLNSSNIEQINNQRIQILPNPTEGIIEVRGIEDYNNLNYKVYSLTGQIIQSGSLRQTIDLSSRKGIYFLTIMRHQQMIAREKIIVK